ncbi:hypothetical protein [Streptomyces sp. NPDC005407]|uniref:hypothetical protein n=1 Tax=Streptomyces sp. NPDC005407 TaxID=3155340 RepID=UPI0033B84D69
MPRAPRSIEEALSRARVFEGEYSASQLEASRERLARDLTESRWMQLFSEAGPARNRPPTTLHEQAQHKLWSLSQNVITNDEAAGYIARFEDDRDPGGALAFACLLDLADAEQGAQFWWQFAAGAGNSTSALCLYLLHLRRGELRDAQHWASQIPGLENTDQYEPVPHEAIDPEAPAAGITMRFEATADDDSFVPDHAVKDTVDHLDVDELDDFGSIPQPSVGLADQLKELVTAAR